MKKEYRVKTEKEFQKVFEEGHSVANRQFVVYRIEKPEQSHYRVGFSVGKKIGPAVIRNKIKRRLRHGIQLLDKEYGIKSELDFIIIARKPVSVMSFDQILQSLFHVLSLAQVFDHIHKE